MPFLSRLLDILFPPKRDALIIRTVHEERLLALLSPATLEAGTALLPYRTKEVGALIREAKFSGSERAWELLAAMLREYLLEYLGDRMMYEERIAVLVPVPLSKKRYRERGYNQVEEVLKRVRLDGVTLAKVLRRTRDTKKQTSLSRTERLRNLNDAFTAERIDPALLYIVVDDVYTTGATLGEAERALRAGGGRHVHAVSLSH